MIAWPTGAPKQSGIGAREGGGLVNCEETLGGFALHSAPATRPATPLATLDLARGDAAGEGEARGVGRAGR
jgi:hypothetical protein